MKMFSGNEERERFTLHLTWSKAVAVTPRESVGLPKRWSGAVAAVYSNLNFGSPPHPTQSLYFPPFLIFWSLLLLFHLFVGVDFLRLVRRLEGEVEEISSAAILSTLSHAFFFNIIVMGCGPLERDLATLGGGSTLFEERLKVNLNSSAPPSRLSCDMRKWWLEERTFDELLTNFPNLPEFAKTR